MINQYIEPEDFLMDDTFIQYLKGSNQKCVVFWEAWIEKHPEKHLIVEKAKRLHQILSGNLKPVHQQLAFINEQISTEKKVRKFGFRFYGIAASFFIVLLTGLIYFNFQKTTKPIIYAQAYVSEKGERKKITLADGSLVYLNSDSKLEIDEDFNKRTRNVRLSGEAFFDVKHDQERPFKVSTKWYKIIVLGTAFNVKSYANEKKSEATLVRGVIRLEDNELKGSSVILRRGQKIVYMPPFVTDESSHDIPSHSVDVLPKLEVTNLTMFDHKVVESAWIDNDMVFSNKTFLDIKPLLERWFNIEIIFQDKDIENTVYTASFKNEDLHTILTKLQQVKHFDFEQKGGRIIIY
ncbi:FecR family protein [Pedobacter nyackensis]|uniref:FecR family protein n=1 Tax=Pedobacter nyackensis TaxID=475255 RepID=A0A1W2DKC0_9SPHI|nr:FecR family protein [Pedobacter nyackensis]SMC97934.1 FecR family protein [Pedobacter nyackensis]